MSDKTTRGDEFYEWLVELLDRRDPIELVSDTNPGREYTSEAREIIAALPGMESAAHLTDKIHAIFVRYFAPDIAGPPEHYRALAQEIFARYRSVS